MPSETRAPTTSTKWCGFGRGKRFTARKVTSEVARVLFSQACGARPASSFFEKPGWSSSVSKARWPSLATSRSESAITLALRGARSSRARSPKNPPGPRTATWRPWRSTRACPSMITKNSVPAAPSFTTTLPGGECHPLGRLRHHRQLLLGAGGEEGHRRQGVDERVAARHGEHPATDSCRACGNSRRAGNSEPRMKVDSVTLKSGSGLRVSGRRTPAAISNPAPAIPTSAHYSGGTSHVQGRRNRPRHHQLSRRGPRGRRARRRAQLRGWPHHPVGGRVLEDRRGPRGRGRQAPGHHQPRSHDPLGQAPHGHRLEDRHRRQELQLAGDLRPHPAEAQARRRGLPGRHRHPGRDHRARLLRRRRAPGHQGGGRDRRPRGAAHHQRAHRGRARPTGSTRTTTRPSSCSTSVAARSTCRSSTSARACSR